MPHEGQPLTRKYLKITVSFWMEVDIDDEILEEGSLSFDEAVADILDDLRTKEGFIRTFFGIKGDLEKLDASVEITGELSDTKPEELP